MVDNAARLYKKAAIIYSVVEAKRRRGEEAKRRRGEEAKRRRGEDAKRRRGEEAKRRRGEEAKNCSTTMAHGKLRVA
jgi:hypothetical protein